MNVSAPVSQVIQYLKSVGYRVLPKPLVIRGLTFSFPAVLTGSLRAIDLVVVLDTADQDSNESIVRQVIGLARALDMANKRNPVTTIVVGPRPPQPLIAEMMSVCRVLPVGTLSDDDAKQILNHWLTALVPLPTFDEQVEVDPLGELGRRTVGLQTDVAAIPRRAHHGKQAVSNTIDEILSNELAHILAENE